MMGGRWWPPPLRGLRSFVLLVVVTVVAGAVRGDSGARGEVGGDGGSPKEVGETRVAPAGRGDWSMELELERVR